MTREAIVELVKEVFPEAAPYLKMAGGAIIALLPQSEILSGNLGEWSALITHVLMNAMGLYVMYWAAIGVKNRSKKREAEMDSINLDNQQKQRDLEK